MGLVLEGSASSAHRFAAAIAARRYRPVRVPKQHELDVLDMALICIFLIGLYTNYTIPLATKVPLPSAPAGLAGLSCCGVGEIASRPTPSSGSPW